MLKVFEAFAGYGSQRIALKNIGVPHKVVGISEIDESAILSYAAIHEDLINIYNTITDIPESEMREFLKSINIPLDYRTFQIKADKLKGIRLKKLYYASKLSKNYGDIRIINPYNLPDFDFFTYSFPCQDISIAGYQNGLSENSGTRSSLLWECCKIIEVKKPQFLMMENVKNLIGKNHKKQFENFLSYLSNLGYINSWAVLNAKDYGIPHNRERVFCISILKNIKYTKKYEFPKPKILKLKARDLLDVPPDKKFYLPNQFIDTPLDPEYIYCLDANYWKGTTLTDFLSKKRRQLVTDIKNTKNLYPVRRLTPKEAWRFMGMNDIDFYKASLFNSNTSLYKQAGNSIVIPVMEEIFKNLFFNEV